MAESEDESQKTEEPSEKRLRDAIEKGQVIFSKELNSFLLFVMITLIVVGFIPFLLPKIHYFLKNIIEDAAYFSIERVNLGDFASVIVKKILLFLALPFSLIVIIVILSSFMQMGTFVLSTDPISPKLSNLSLMKGLKRLFSLKSLIEFFKGIIKIIIVGGAIYFVIRPYIGTLSNIYLNNIDTIISILFNLIKKIFIVTSIILAFVAVMDYLYQRYEYYQSLRMTKQEVKEEYKQQEGSPEIKAKLKKIRSDRSRRRMMQEVPKSDVVITNPTHYSVALKYDAKEMRAPILVAKGQDIIALKIREVARDNKIPIVENPILSRALYANVEVGQEIPVEYYKAVAEVISYVYSIKK